MTDQFFSVTSLALLGYLDNSPRGVTRVQLRRYEGDMENISSRLKQLRLSRGWSQEDLARLIDVSLSTVQRWEKSEPRPTRLGRKALERLFRDNAVQ